MGSRLIHSRWLAIVAWALLVAAAPTLAVGRAVRGSDITVVGDYSVEAAVTDLAAPTMVAFDDQGRMLIAESGYNAGGPSRVTRIEANGSRTTLPDVPESEMPLTSVAFHDGFIYYVTATTVWRIADGEVVPTALITGLPGLGDHQPNQLVFVGDRLYLAIGTATNSAVVGPDNAIFGWLKMADRRQVHDIPCRDVTVAGPAFESKNPFDGTSEQTSAYSPYGTALPAGTVVSGALPCNGAILSYSVDGSDPRLEAWGLRNPYGLELGADGQIYFSMHGDDARGSRPIENAPDCLYRLQPGAWYGWPDYACDAPVTDPAFRPHDKPQPAFVLSSHPTDTPPAPIAEFDPHAAANGFAFSPGGEWGPITDAYVALFGDATPATGTVDRPAGVEVVRVDALTGAVTPFLSNVIPGESTEHLLGGLEHPSDVTFGPDGSMYVADWGTFRDTLEGLELEPNSGVVWRVSYASGAAAPFSLGLVQNIGLTLLLAVAAVVAAIGRRRVLSLRGGVTAGLVAAAAMGIVGMFVVSPLLKLPWFGLPRVLATIPMGRTAVANIVEFEPLSFLVGIVVLAVMGVAAGLAFALLLRTRTRWRIVLAGLLFGLALWAAAQWLVLPALFPLISDKGLPPAWLAATLSVLGTTLGVVAAWFARTGRSYGSTSREWQDVSPNS
jgi:glucose/arabinose dehydrogenase